METEKKVYECDHCGKIQDSFMSVEPYGWLKISKSDSNGKKANIYGGLFTFNFCSHKCAIKYLENEIAVAEDIPF